MTERAPLRYRDVAFFFFPLLLNVQLMSVSHSVINAVLARQEDAIRSLAAFSVAMVIHLFLASPSYQNHTVTIAMVQGRQSLKGVTTFVLLVAGYVSVMLMLVATTPVGTLLLAHGLGVTDDLLDETRRVILFLAILPFITGFRGLFQGIVIRARKTSLVSFATGVRIAALFGYLLIGAQFLEGAAIGAFALVGCVATETLLVGWFALRCGIPKSGAPEKTTREIIRFAFPLAYSSCLQQTIPLLITAIIGRLPDAHLSLAAFGVVRGFIFLLAGPMRNLQQAYLTLVATTADYRVLRRFFIHTGLVLGLLMIATAWPLRHLVLGNVMGISGDLQTYVAWPLAFCAAYPLLYGAANLLRGTFAAAHRTELLGRSTIYKSGYMLLWWILLGFFPLPLSGIIIGIFLLMSAEILEAWYLNRQRILLDPLPPS